MLWLGCVCAGSVWSRVEFCEIMINVYDVSLYKVCTLGGGAATARSALGWYRPSVGESRRKKGAVDTYFICVGKSGGGSPGAGNFWAF